MRKVLLLCLFALCFSCANKIQYKDLTLLNGYWEIKEVIFKDGGRKEYKVNTTIDLIYIDSTSGYRKKVQPKFNGSYLSSKDAEHFSIKNTQDSYIMQYKTALSSWTEELITLNSEEFSVKTINGTIYNYKKYTPINGLE